MQTTSDRNALLLAVDASIALAAVLIAAHLRFGSQTYQIWALELGLPPIINFAAVFVLLTLASFGMTGVYRSEIYWSLKQELGDLLKGIILLGVTSLSLLFLLKYLDVSRIAIATTFTLLLIGTVSLRILVRYILGRRARTNRGLRQWLVIGCGANARGLTELVNDHPSIGARIVGYLADEYPPNSLPVLGNLDALDQVLEAEIVDEVILAADSVSQSDLERLLSICAIHGKVARLSMNMLAPSVFRGRVEDFAGIPMWAVLDTPEHRVALALKRLVDVVGAALTLIITSPLWIYATIGILLSDGRPILYSQIRGGHNGRSFCMYKFRTMVMGADLQRDGLSSANQRRGPVFKIKEDPRITPFGQLLRRTSIDELPQLINVLKGEMSLVGPRPQPIEEVHSYDPWHRRRLTMRPGITGLWQVSARHDPDFESWMDHDLDYIERWSLMLDLTILARTPAALVRTPGE